MIDEELLKSRIEKSLSEYDNIKSKRNILRCIIETVPRIQLTEKRDPDTDKLLETIYPKDQILGITISDSRREELYNKFISDTDEYFNK